MAHSTSLAEATTLAQSEYISNALFGSTLTAKHNAACSVAATVCGNHAGNVTHAALAGVPSGYTCTAAAPAAERMGSVQQKQEPSV